MAAFTIYCKWHHQWNGDALGSHEVLYVQPLELPSAATFRLLEKKKKKNKEANVTAEQKPL